MLRHILLYADDVLVLKQYTRLQNSEAFTVNGGITF